MTQLNNSGCLRTRLLSLAFAGLRSSAGETAHKGRRSVYRHELGERVDYAVYDRTRLFSADRLEGPAIIEEPSSTTVIHAGDLLTVGEYGELVIDTSGGDDHE
ncbi:MAG: hypothetical protein AAF629_12785 [Chloroflexota bacterium]